MRKKFSYLVFVGMQKQGLKGHGLNYYFLRVLHDLSSVRFYSQFSPANPKEELTLAAGISLTVLLVV